MARLPINRGSSANDGTGDTLRSAAGKINDNFSELYTAFGTSADSLGSPITFDSDGIVFTDSEGHTTKLTFQNPDASGQTLTLENKTGVIPTIVNEGGHHGRVIDLRDSAGPAATAAKVYFGNAFDSFGDLPDALVYHGMFAFLHDSERAVVAHGNTSTDWVKLLDDGTLSSGTYSINANKSTIQNLNLLTPRINSTILDSADNEILGLETVGTPKNYVQLTAKDSSPTIAAVGDDPNVDLILQAKGTGTITLGGAVNHSTKVRSSPNVLGIPTPLTDNAETLMILNTGSPTTFVAEDGHFDGERKVLANFSTSINTISFTSGGGSGGLAHRKFTGAPLPHNVNLHANSTIEIIWSQDAGYWFTTYPGDSVTNFITFN